MARHTFSAVIFLTVFFFCDANPVLSTDVPVQNLNGRIQTEYLKDYKFVQDVSGSLKLHREPATLHDATVICQNEGGIVASPINDKFLDAMQYVLFKTGLDALRTGIHAKGFYSMEGIPLSEMPISLAEDGTESKLDNVMLFSDGSASKENTNNTHPFICYKKTTACRSGYQLSTETNSCYKFHKVGQTWPKALGTCATEGGHLADINSDKEARVLREIFANNPANTIQAGATDIAMIGFNNLAAASGSGNWITIFGQTLSSAGYSRWKSGEPNTGSENRYLCGAINRDAELYAAGCDWDRTFICEMKPWSPEH